MRTERSENICNAGTIDLIQLDPAQGRKLTPRMKAISNRTRPPHDDILFYVDPRQVLSGLFLNRNTWIIRQCCSFETSSLFTESTELYVVCSAPMNQHNMINLGRIVFYYYPLRVFPFWKSPKRRRRYFSFPVTSVNYIPLSGSFEKLVFRVFLLFANWNEQSENE